MSGTGVELSVAANPDAVAAGAAVGAGVDAVAGAYAVAGALRRTIRGRSSGLNCSPPS